MKNKKLEIVIIPPKSPPTKEDMLRLAEFFDTLLTWHLEEKRGSCEKEI